MEHRKGITGKAQRKCRVFALDRTHENQEFASARAAKRAIERVLFEWEERENGRLAEIPSAVEELVHFYCLDYERRQKALEERARLREKLKEEENARKKAEAKDAEKEDSGTEENARRKAIAAKKEDGTAEEIPFFTQESFFSDDGQPFEKTHESHRLKRSGGRRMGVRVKRKRADKRFPTAPIAANYRRINMLIDLALSLACEEGVRETMLHDIAARRGHRRTSLYYLDRRAYLQQKRKAKLAIAAALGLL